MVCRTLIGYIGSLIVRFSGKCDEMEALLNNLGIVCFMFNLYTLAAFPIEYCDHIKFV